MTLDPCGFDSYITTTFVVHLILVDSYIGLKLCVSIVLDYGITGVANHVNEKFMNMVLIQMMRGRLSNNIIVRIVMTFLILRLSKILYVRVFKK